MKRKSILALTLVTMLSTSMFISGCGKTSDTKSGSETANNAEGMVDKDKNDVANGTNTIGDDIENGAEAVNDGVERVGNDIKYTAIDFKNDLVNAGHEIKDSMDGKKGYFTGTETSYMLGNDAVHIYEYDSTDKLNADIKTISEDGMTINGKDVGYTNKPHYYSKGNTLIVYEGNDPTYIDQFNKTYGATIIP